MDPKPAAAASPSKHDSTIAAVSNPHPSTHRPDPATPMADSMRAATLTSPTVIPTRIGKFEIRSLLGSGAFGRVFHGFDPELRRDVAIKVPRAEALTPEFLERFIREARAAATIRHANVCPVYDVGCDETHGLPFIVMGFVPGKTLADVIHQRGGPFQVKQAAHIVRRLALALDAAHAKGVVHRDLKPGNILFDTEHKDVLITDFGLAKLVGEIDAAQTKIGDVLGTPAYMSPEQARGAIDAIGPKSDIYSLGVILYEMLTGQLPFKGTATEVICQVMSAVPTPASVVCPGLDPRLDAICKKAMAKDPATRYSARDLAAALTEYLKTADIPAVPESQDYAPSEVIPATAVSVSPAPIVEVPEEEVATAVTRRPKRSKNTKRKAAQQREARKRLILWSVVGVLAFAGVTYGVVRAVRPSPQPTTTAKVDAPSTPSPTAPRTPSNTPPLKLPPPPLTDPATIAPPMETAPTPHAPGTTPPMPMEEDRPPLDPEGRPYPKGPNGKYPLIGPDGVAIPLGPDGRPAMKGPNGEWIPVGPDGKPLQPGPDGKYPRPGDGPGFIKGPDGELIPLGPDGKPVPKMPDGKYPKLGPDGRPMPPFGKKFGPPGMGGPPKP